MFSSRYISLILILVNQCSLMYKPAVLCPYWLFLGSANLVNLAVESSSVFWNQVSVRQVIIFPVDIWPVTQIHAFFFFSNIYGSYALPVINIGRAMLSYLPHFSCSFPFLQLCWTAVSPWYSVDWMKILLNYIDVCHKVSFLKTCHNLVHLRPTAGVLCVCKVLTVWCVMQISVTDPS